MLMTAVVVNAQKTVEAVYLKNGGLVKGEITEQVPNDHLKIKTKDGNIFVYKMDEVERIAKEVETTESANPSNMRHRGVDFNLDMGYNIPTQGGDGNPVAGLSLGKRFSESFYWGMGAGINIPTSGGDVSIPIFTETKMYFPLRSSKFTPLASLKAGYVINTADDIRMKVGKSWQTIKPSNYVLLQIMPGVSYPLSGSVDFSLSAGYQHYVAVGGDGENFGAIAIRAGFDFHKNVKKKAVIVPTRNRGVQLTVEADGISPWNFGEDGFGAIGGNLIIGYKINPNISVGLGGGYSWVNCSGSDFTEYVNEYNSADEIVDVTEYRSDTNGGRDDWSMGKIFLRGQYRLNDNKFSPIFALDLGMRMYSWSGRPRLYETWSSSYGSDDSDISKSSFFVAPAVGFSLRTTSNSYFEMKVGYEIAQAMEEKTFYSDNSYNHNYYGYKRNSVTFSPHGMGGVFLTLGWTHTFGARAK